MNLFAPKPIYGVIYDASWGQTYGEVTIVTSSGFSFTLPYDKFLKVKDQLLSSDIGIGVVRGVGAGLVTLGVSGAVITARPIVQAEIGYRINKTANIIVQATHSKEYEEAIKQAQEAAQEREYAAKFAQEVGVTQTDFAIYIPKIDARAPVFANVDPAVEETYMASLKTGVAHAYGSSLPGRPGATYIFAHSTNGPWNVSQYNAVFYLLRELNPENRDEVYVFFQGKVHKYRITEKHVIDGDDVSWLTEAQTGKERLILQTCWPPGTIWKRLLVVAEPTPADNVAVYGGAQ
ncbi:MAG: sortase [Patescibacteria group bacterium]